jgi:hypothetical protein
VVVPLVVTVRYVAVLVPCVVVVVLVMLVVPLVVVVVKVPEYVADAETEVYVAVTGTVE